MAVVRTATFQVHIHRGFLDQRSQTAVFVCQHQQMTKKINYVNINLCGNAYF